MKKREELKQTNLKKELSIKNMKNEIEVNKNRCDFQFYSLI